MDPLPSEPPQRPPNNRLVIVGGAVALLAGLVIAWMLLMNGRGERSPAPPASQGGLVIESGEDQSSIDPAKPLRCFVAGQFVGDLTLSDCARRNGVATDALDVGLDQSGALAASQTTDPSVTPLPPEDPPPKPVDAVMPVDAVPAAPPAAVQGACWRYGRGQWVRLPGDLDLNACVQQLFAGRCERQGAAEYGRWSQQTLRLVAGRIETSNDNASFRTLVMQGAGCAIPPVG